MPYIRNTVRADLTHRCRNDQSLYRQLCQDAAQHTHRTAVNCHCRCCNELKPYNRATHQNTRLHQSVYVETSNAVNFCSTVGSTADAMYSAAAAAADADADHLPGSQNTYWTRMEAPTRHLQQPACRLFCHPFDLSHLGHLLVVSAHV